jgi:hypothetical protein
MWAMSDVTMTVRAITRLLAAAGLIALALATDVATRPLAVFVWLLCTNVLSLAHAMRLWNLSFADRLGQRGRPGARLWPAVERAWRRVFIYPQRPHINIVAVLEISAMAWAAAEIGGSTAAIPAIGSPSAFAGDPSAFIVAAALISFVYATVVANIQAHVVWYIHPHPRQAPWARHELLFRKFNLWYGWGMAPIATGLLWPYDTLTAEAGAPLLPIAVVVVAPLAAALSAHLAFLTVRLQGRELLLLSDRAVATARIEDSRVLHAYLKSGIRVAMSALPDDAPPPLRDAMQQLLGRASAVDAALLRNSLAIYRNASDVVRSMTAPGSEWARYANCVVEDIAPDLELDPTDAFWVSVYVSDLFTNAAKANATHISIAVRQTTHEGAPSLQVEVICACDDQPTAFSPTSSVARMANAVGARGGRFLYTPGLPHTFVVTWPDETNRAVPLVDRKTVTHD